MRFGLLIGPHRRERQAGATAAAAAAFPSRRRAGVRTLCPPSAAPWSPETWARRYVVGACSIVGQKQPSLCARFFRSRALHCVGIAQLSSSFTLPRD